ncbi:MAG: T9SS type A sorting domain-containing protein [bacterium]
MKMKIFGSLAVALFLTSYTYGVELSYDDGTPTNMFSNSSGCPGYYAVKFTASAKCQVMQAKPMVHIWRGVSELCCAYIWDDNSGLPGTLKDSTMFSPIEDSIANWNTVDFAIPPVFNAGVSFWVGVLIPPERWSPDTNIILVTTDGGINNTGGNAGKSDVQGWTVLTQGSGNWNVTGDLMIRAEIQLGVEESEIKAPTKVTLNQNTPNPVHRGTTISYTIPQTGKVNLTIYDITGKPVRTLVNAEQKPGFNNASWDKKTDDGSSVSSGVYFYKLNIKGYNSITKTMIVL